MSMITEYSNEMSPKDPSVKRPPTIEITNPNVYTKLSELAEKEGRSLRKYANDILEMVVTNREYLSVILPKLKRIAFDEGHLYILDTKEEAFTAIVGLKNNLPYCSHCEVHDCVHTLYAYAMPELSKLDIIKTKGSNHK